MRIEKIRNSVLFGCIIFIMTVGALYIGLPRTFGTLLEIPFPRFTNDNNTVDVDEQSDNDGDRIDEIKSEYQELSEAVLDTLPLTSELINFSGSFIKLSGSRSYYDQEYNINVSTDGYIVGASAATSTDYEIEQITAFKEYLDSKGIGLLYVNEPYRYTEDGFFKQEFGRESYVNRNADLFLRRLAENNIHFIDLRDNIAAEGIDAQSLFYRTDHHWTVPASLWASRIIAEELNQSYGYDIDLSLYDLNNFNIVEYEDCWLGEQGRKIGKGYAGLDNFTMIEPLYNTSYTVVTSDETSTGSFSDVFINKSIYKNEDGLSENKSWHYSYKGYGSMHNENVSCGNVLILGDSFERTMSPFLSLGIQDLTVIVPRTLPEHGVIDKIESGEYDTVIVAFYQTMIGQHDIEGSSNYYQFRFD